MLTVQTSTRVDGLTGNEVYDFLTHPSDRAYRAWWPGTHLRFHPVDRGVGDRVGDVVAMDEYIGERRLCMHAIVREAVRGKRLVWQLAKGVRLPASLVLEFADQSGGVQITHTIHAGLRGVGRVLDPLWKLYFTQGFTAALDAHVRTEFARLREVLRPAGASDQRFA